MFYSAPLNSLQILYSATHGQREENVFSNNERGIEKQSQDATQMDK